MADAEDKRKNNDKSTALEKSNKGGKDSHLVKLGDDIIINTNNRRPELDVETIKAYAGQNKRGDEHYFALVCEPHLTPRVRAASNYYNITNPRLLQLARRGVTFWPPAGQERYVLVFRDMMGKPIVKADQVQALGLKPDHVVENVLRPIVNIMLDFRDKGFFHGGIRLTNIYDGGEGNLSKIVLGQALATPASYMQPVLYETIQRGMADRIARGPGLQSDDIYALGVLMAVMLRSADPMSGFTNAEITKRKLELGSYAALTGQDRFKGSTLELLRGLLHDDPKERFTIEEVQEWIDGRRTTPKQAKPRRKAERPIAFGGERYYQLSTLAMDLNKNATETRRIIDEGDLEHWLVRSLGEETLFENISDMVNQVRIGSQNNAAQDKVVTVVSSCLDPAAPIRYKNLRINPDGIGTALASAMVQNEDVNPYADILNQAMVSMWVREQQKAGLDPPLLGSNYELCIRYLRKSIVGLGIERCLYELNNDAHCLSDKLKNYYVLSAEELLYALDDYCKKGNSSSLFIDRHIAAFLSTQDAQYIDDLLPMLNASEYHTKLLANLRCFANIQRREKMPALVGLAKGFAALMPAVYKRYHDQETRERLEKEVEKTSQTGDLVKLADIVDNPSTSEKDFRAFKSAMQEYRELRNEHTDLSARLANKKTYGLKTGRYVSALIALALSGVVILGLTFANFF